MSVKSDILTPMGSITLRHRLVEKCVLQTPFWNRAGPRHSLSISQSVVQLSRLSLDTQSFVSWGWQLLNMTQTSNSWAELFMLNFGFMANPPGLRSFLRLTAFSCGVVFDVNVCLSLSYVRCATWFFCEVCFFRYYLSLLLNFCSECQMFYVVIHCCFQTLFIYWSLSSFLFFSLFFFNAFLFTFLFWAVQEEKAAKMIWAATNNLFDCSVCCV